MKGTIFIAVHLHPERTSCFQGHVTEFRRRLRLSLALITRTPPQQAGVRMLGPDAVAVGPSLASWYRAFDMFCETS